MTELAETLVSLARDVEQLEADLDDALARIEELELSLTASEQRVGNLEDELADARSDDDVIELIGDVRRGIRDLDELYERTLEP